MGNKPISRQGVARNRALRDEDQPPEPSEQELQADAWRLQVRQDARTGMPYGKVAEKHKITVDAVMAIIRGDLVQRVDAETQELIPPPEPEVEPEA